MLKCWHVENSMLVVFSCEKNYWQTSSQTFNRFEKLGQPIARVSVSVAGVTATTTRCHNTFEISIKGISLDVCIIFGLPLTCAYATLEQSVAVNLSFLDWFNLCTTNSVMLNFAPMLHWHPNSFPTWPPWSTSLTWAEKKWHREKHRNSALHTFHLLFTTKGVSQ